MNKEIAHIFDLTGEVAIVTGEDGRAALEMALGTYASHFEKRPFWPPPRTDNPKFLKLMLER